MDVGEDEGLVESSEHLRKFASFGPLRAFTCAHPSHGEPVVLTLTKMADACDHLKICCGETATTSAVSALLRDCIIENLRVLTTGQTGILLGCKGCKSPVVCTQVSLRNHFKDCFGASPRADFYKTYLEDLQLQESTSFPEVMFTSESADLKAAILGRDVESNVMLSCPGQGCSACFADILGLVAHISRGHQRRVGCPLTASEIATRAAKCMTLRLTAAKHVRVFENRARFEASICKDLVARGETSSDSGAGGDGSLEGAGEGLHQDIAAPAASLPLPRSPLSPERSGVLPHMEPLRALPVFQSPAADPLFDILEAASHSSTEFLLPESMRLSAPRYVSELGWHTQEQSSLFGPSRRVAMIFRAAAEAVEGASEEALFRLWCVVLDDANSRVHACRATAPQLLGAGEAQDKVAIHQQSFVIEDDAADSSDSGVNNIGSTHRRPISPLTSSYVQSEAKILARLCLYINGRHILDAKERGSTLETPCDDRGALGASMLSPLAKSARVALPFPAELVALDRKHMIHATWHMMYHLEFAPEHAGRRSALGLKIGHISHFLWASALQLGPHGDITEFTSGSEMARICNACTHALRFAILFYRTLATLPHDIVPERLAFHHARSSALLASTRQRTQNDLGHESNKRVLIEADETMKRGHAVVVINLPGQDSRLIDRHTICVGYNSALVCLQREVCHALSVLDVNENDRYLLSSPALKAIIHDPRARDISHLSFIEGEEEEQALSFVDRAQLQAYLVNQVRELDAEKRRDVAQSMRTIQNALLFLLYWGVLGTPRCPDLFHISQTTERDSSVRFVRDKNGHGRHVFSASAISPRLIQYSCGSSKTHGDKLGAPNSQVSLLDPFTSHHLALFCFLTRIVRQALGEREDPSGFHCIWNFKDVDDLRTGFQAASQSFLQVSIGVEDSRQVKAQIAGEDTRFLDDAVATEMRVREASSALRTTHGDFYLPVKFGHTFDRHKTSYNKTSLQERSQNKLDIAWRVYLGPLMCLEVPQASNPRPRSLLPTHLSEDAVMCDISTKLLKGNPLKPAQREALSHFLRGKDTAVLAPVGCGKSLVFVASAYLAGKRGQIVMLLSPMKCIALNAASACAEASLVPVVYSHSMADSILLQLRTRAGIPGAASPFDLIIVSFESWMGDSSFSDLLYECKSRNLLAALVFDEW
jgi:hypothetical protein